MKMKHSLSVFLILGLLHSASAQSDSVDVTFRYTPPVSPSSVTLPGEFNGWNNQIWPMTNIGNNIWVKTVRLRIGGNPNPPPIGIPGAWQYKFYYPNIQTWPNDPLDHHVNPADNDNSYIYTRDPTIYQLLPNQRQSSVSTAFPTISAYLFPKFGSVVDTSAISLNVDGGTYKAPGNSYDLTTKLFSYILPQALSNGQHTLILTAGSSKDTVSFFVQAGFVQILNQGPLVTRNPSRTIYGSVRDTSIHSARIVRERGRYLGIDTFRVSVSQGRFSAAVSLDEGLNVFIAEVDTGTGVALSGQFAVTYLVNHAPSAKIGVVDGGGTITLTATESTDPDSGQSALLTYDWSTDPSNPEAIAGVDGSKLQQVVIQKPRTPGEYYFGLIAIDPSGNRDTTRNYFTLLHPDSAIKITTYASVPSWVRQGRVYELFFKAFTSEGTINAAIPRLAYIKDMGFNIIWVMPVMTNLQINNGSGTGYNIIDFYTVTPQYGTNQDFKNFVNESHRLGMKVILDVTPNHTGSQHPFVTDIRTFKQYSKYWGWYQNQPITNPNYHPNLSEAVTSDGLFVYYSGFSDALLNYNWSDLDARNYMIDVYKWWIKEMGVDGYRFDVYWGPHRRANNGNGGENEMGQPVREALRHIKPDIYLLAEDDGTGPGTEVIYADMNGGVESGYDWGLYFNAFRNFWVSSTPAIDALNFRLLNGGSSSMGFLPGSNSYFLRFMENHDEDRISFLYGSFERTMPVATSLFTSVGLPLLYQGQEVGWGLGISGFDPRRRGVIDWNFAGRTLLTPHYQKLAQIRRQFPAFSSQQMVRASTGNDKVYAFTRPYPDQSGITIVNFDGAQQNALVTLEATGSSPHVIFRGGVKPGTTYYASDLYNDKVDTVVFTGPSATLSTTLPPFGSRVLVLANQPYHLVTNVDETPSQGIPQQVRLYQNYPNPFNPMTTIDYSLPKRSFVTLRVFDMLGRVIKTLVNGEMDAGNHQVQLDGIGLASGVYFYQLVAESVVETRKLLLLK